MYKKKKIVDLNHYNELIKQIIVDEKIRVEIVEIINCYKDKSVCFDGNNLYGKKLNKKGNDYLEIKYENYKFSCIYTDWQSKKRVIITQDNLKENQKYINRVEFNYVETLNDNLENEKDSLRTEKIYDKDNKLIYESNLTQKDRFDSINNFMCYKNDCFTNIIKLNKKWYINDVIIQYDLEKQYLSDYLYEQYSICPGKIKTDFENLYLFNDLERDLFINFMTGKITIRELLEKNSKKADETAKQYFKHSPSIDYI